MGCSWISWPDLVEIIGANAAQALCGVYGGVSVYVPKSASEGNPLCQRIGLQALAKLSAVYGGECITVPNRRRPQPVKAAALNLLEQGISAREIAQKLAVTQRYVEQLARTVARTGRQELLPGIE